MSETDIVNIMRDRIVDHFHPMQIILFGSRARGDERPDSDVDLIVVFPHIENSRRTRVAIHNVLSDLPAGKDILVATPDELEAHKLLLGSVFRPALREGKIIMTKTPKSAEEVAVWLQFAQEDLTAAESLLEDEHVTARHVCFFAQQLAEKALKAGLIFSGLEVPRIHDLDELRNRLPDTFAVKNSHPKLGELSEWVVDGRYPGYWPLVTKEEATEVLEMARSVLVAIRDDLERLK